MQENLYKQAIADAKALRASAIANAKAALQETFAPQVEAIVKQSLREEAEDELEESADEEPIEKDARKKLGIRGEMGSKYSDTYTQKAKKLGDGDYPEDLDEEEKMEEARRKKHHEKIEERKRHKKMEERRHKVEESEEELEESEEEMDEDSLEEILRELEEMDEDQEEEEEGHHLEEEEEESEEEPEEEHENEDDEEIVLTFGQLKQALEPFIGGEGDEEGGEESDVDLDEILGEDDHVGMEEGLHDTIKKVGTAVKSGIKKAKDYYKQELSPNSVKQGGKYHGRHATLSSNFEEAKKMEERKHKKEMEEAKKAIEELRGSLNEVNLLNAKLLYMNRIFKAKSLTESQKVKVVGAFDRASNVKEVKNIYATLNESITSKKRQLRENYNGFASKPSGTAQRQLITEADPFVARMQRLAGIN